MTKLKSSQIIKSFEKGPVRRSLFSNGAVSLFHQFKGMESACVNLYFLAGSVFEKKGQHGIAHVIEHMLFKEERAGSLVQEMESKGAQINAYTYKEYVCFELDCAADSLDEFLPKFLSLFLNPVFNSKDLALEKKVILQELREDKDDHETEGLEYLYKKNFNEALGHPIGGAIGNVKSFRVKDLETFYKKFYRPERMILSVVGGKKFDSLEKIYMDEFAKAGQKERQQIKPFRLEKKERFSKLKHASAKLKRPMESSIVFYAFDGASIFHPDYYNYLALDEYLLGGMSSKLFMELREKNAYVYGLGSAINTYAACGSYIMIFHTLKKNVGKLRDKVDEALEELAQKGPPAKDIEAIKKRLAQAWSLGFDDMLERNEYLAEMEMLNFSDFSLAGQIQRLNHVSAESVQALVKKIFKSKYSLLIMNG
ncbi:MAG: pitrilysin family protein [Bacteriovoracaceae bacterium]